MSKHPGPLTIERQVSPEEALHGAPGAAMAATQVSKRGNRTLRRLLLAGATVAGLGVGLSVGWDYWTVGRFHISTDNAYVQADNVTIAPKVPGYLAEVLIRDNQRVRAGQVLARIYDRDYRGGLDKATADVQAALALTASKKAPSKHSRPSSRRRRQPSP